MIEMKKARDKQLKNKKQGKPRNIEIIYDSLKNEFHGL